MITAEEVQEIKVSQPHIATALLAVLMARFSESLQGKTFRAYHPKKQLGSRSGWQHSIIYVDSPEAPLNAQPVVFVSVGEHAVNKEFEITYYGSLGDDQNTGMLTQVYEPKGSFYDSMSDHVRAIAHHFRIVKSPLANLYDFDAYRIHYSGGRVVEFADSESMQHPPISQGLGN